MTVTGYGKYSLTEYNNNTDNMAVPESLWIRALLDEQPDLQSHAPLQWTRPDFWGDDTGTIHEGLRLAGMTAENTDAGYLYAEITAADGLIFYKDELKENAVGEIEPGADTFTELNDSGLRAAPDFAFELPETADLTDQDNIKFRFTTVWMEILNLRNDVFERMVRRLVKNVKNLHNKPEYLIRLNDKTELKLAEIYCGLMIFFEKQRSFNVHDSKSTLENLYRNLFHAETDKLLSWDMSVLVEIEKPRVKVVAQKSILEVDFL